MQKIQNYIISVYDKSLCLRTEGINYEPERVLRHQPKKQRSSQNANHDCPRGNENERAQATRAKRKRLLYCQIIPTQKPSQLTKHQP